MQETLKQRAHGIPLHVHTAISIYIVGSKPQAYNPESLKLILIYPYRLSVLSRTLEALIRQRKLK